MIGKCIYIRGRGAGFTIKTPINIIDYGGTTLGQSISVGRGSFRVMVWDGQAWLYNSMSRLG